MAWTTQKNKLTECFRLVFLQYWQVLESFPMAIMAIKHIKYLYPDEIAVTNLLADFEFWAIRLKTLGKISSCDFKDHQNVKKARKTIRILLRCLDADTPITDLFGVAGRGTSGFGFKAFLKRRKLKIGAISEIKNCFLSITTLVKHLFQALNVDLDVSHNMESKKLKKLTKAMRGYQGTHLEAVEIFRSVSFLDYQCDKWYHGLHKEREVGFDIPVKVEASGVEDFGERVKLFAFEDEDELEGGIANDLVEKSSEFASQESVSVYLADSKPECQLDSAEADIRVMPEDSTVKSLSSTGSSSSETLCVQEEVVPSESAKELACKPLVSATILVEFEVKSVVSVTPPAVCTGLWLKALVEGLESVASFAKTASVSSSAGGVRENQIGVEDMWAERW
ncbi:hypothetical protein HDU97_006262 [Phlyctochytrium planicorne]|nr:hypothetical protein HDU97_006262 [Phlyctochytrium planicorne]